MILFIQSSHSGNTNQCDKITIVIAWGGGWVGRKGHEGPILGDKNILYLDVNICQTELKICVFYCIEINLIDKKILPPK